MQTLTWVGGGNNRANNANDWSPGSAPQSGDTLMVGSGGPFTMNIQGNDLAGDTLVSGSGTLTANLSNQAVATGAIGFGTATYNVKGGSDLTLSISHAAATVSLAGGSTLNLSPGYGSANVSVTGTDNVTMTGVAWRA